MDENYEEEEYLHNRGLQTQGRQAKLDKENQEAEFKVEPKQIIEKIIGHTNDENQNLGNKNDRFSKLKLGSRIGGMMATKFINKKD